MFFECVQNKINENKKNFFKFCAYDFEYFG